MIGILVDLDGVLWFSEELHKSAFIKALSEFTDEAQEIVDKTWMFGEPTELYARKLLNVGGIKFQEHNLDRLVAKKRLFANQTDSVPLNTSLLSFLRRIKNGNVLISLVSSSSKSNVAKFLTISKSYDIFDCLVDLSSVTKPKPHPDCYEYAIRKLGLEPSKCLAIEDSDIGIQSAKAADIKVVLRYPGITSGEDFYITLNSEFLGISKND
jgi:HAD superfamily hydrolase (TIGR01509 family)